MWITFFICVALSLIIVVIPGALILKACSFDLADSVFCAAPISIALYAGVGQVLWIAGISVSGTVFFVLVSVTAIAICFLGSRIRKVDDCKLSFYDGVLPFFGLMLAFAIVCYATVIPLDGPLSFSQHTDNMAHLGTIISMSETGYYSVFNSSIYATTLYNQIPIEIHPAFYPAGWHIICSVISSMVNAPASMAENAVNLAFSGCVYPAGMYALSRRIFSDERDRMQRFLSIVMAVCFVAFPYGMYLYGPLYSNLAAYCVLPAFISLAVTEINLIEKKKKVACHVAVVLLVAFIGEAVLQPNAIFVAIVILLPYLLFRIGHLLDSFGITIKVLGARRDLIVRIVVVLLALLIWCFLANSAPFKSVTSFNWPAYYGLKDAIVNTVDLGLRFGVPQIILSILLWIGLIWSVANRRHSWLIVSFAIFLLMYIVSASTEGFLKHLLTGFWYTDQWRLAASIVLPAAFLSAAGLNKCVKGLLNFESEPDSIRKGSCNNAWLGYALSLVVVCAVVFPSFYSCGNYINTAFGEEKRTLSDLNLLSESNSYSAGDDAFMKQVLNYVDKDDLIINIPADGSISAYMKYGCNLYFKTFGDGDKTPSCSAIVKKLKDYSHDEEVQKAVNEVDAKYVLLLDRNGFAEDGDLLWSTDGIMYKSEWRGIMDVEEQTAGFDLVLSDGTRKLYRIVR